MYFVQWIGDLEKDPMNHGTETYLDYNLAKNFADTHANKGLNVTIYKGDIMPMEYQTSVKEMEGYNIL